MSKNPAIIIGEYLHNERKKKGLSIDKLASICQLSSSQISVIERGKNPQTGKHNNITLTSLELIGKGLDLSVHDILENSGYYNSFHDTIKQSERHFSIHMQTLLKNKYTKLNAHNKDKVLIYIEKLLEAQGKNT
ncbi:MAG: helix-turn-helix domain-containing protein [Coprobacillaceae bacterium]